jgi:hypothetical protein
VARTPSVDALNAEILRAHAIDDRSKLAILYGQTADHLDERGDIDAACFFYTQAYVFALDSGHPDERRYAAILKKRARL